MGNNPPTEERLLSFRHDVGNSLYAVKTLIESHLQYLEASKESLAMTRMKTKRILSKSAKTIDRVINVIRKLNELSISPQEPQLGEVVCVKEILEHVLEALAGAHYLENLNVVKWVPHDLPPLHINLIDLEEIFFNLIVNASQATQKGDCLEIEVRHQKGESRVVISFRDTGRGISEEALPYIFEPFYTERVDEWCWVRTLYCEAACRTKRRANFSRQ